MRLRFPCDRTGQTTAGDTAAFTHMRPVGGGPGALVDLCSGAVADGSGSAGRVAAWATMRQSAADT
jgi:hypothetical protein